MTNKRAKARRNQLPKERRDYPYKTDDTHRYANVLSMLGNGRLRAMCDDGVERQCTIRGNMRCRDWVHTGDTVLVSVRDFDATRADVLFKYQATEVAQLRRIGEIIENVTSETEDVVFEDVDDFELI